MRVTIMLPMVVFSNMLLSLNKLGVIELLDQLDDVIRYRTNAWESIEIGRVLELLVEKLLPIRRQNDK